MIVFIKRIFNVIFNFFWPYDLCTIFIIISIIVIVIIIIILEQSNGIIGLKIVA